MAIVNLRLSTVATLLLLIFSANLPAAEPPQEAEKFDEHAIEYFEKQVRPLLVSRCYKCHGPEAKEPKGGLLLTSRAAALEGGDTGPAMVPGDVKESLLIDSINYKGLYEMPPASKMPEAEIAILTKWIEMGAPWPGGDSTHTPTKEKFDLAARKAAHWAWKPMEDPAVPAIESTWASDPLDKFVLAGLAKQQLQPTSKTDKRSLIRRAYFDLTGLPPTTAQVDAFLADDSPEAFAKVVDELLESPHFGERWGRHWLDLVRYAESRGHEFDYNVANPHEYRDYVIRALNADVPYDQFAREHIAGDLIPNPRMNPESGFNESILGTGFWFLGEWIHSPVDIRKDETDRFDNQIDVFSKTFLGLTVSCARCHDHKFDAISQADYYALAGFLQSSAYRQSRFESADHNQKILGHLEELRDSVRPQIYKLEADLLEAGVEDTPDYLLATVEAFGVAGKSLSEVDPKAGKKAKLLITHVMNAVPEVAKKNKLNEQRLQAWCNYLLKNRINNNDPLYLWGKIALEASNRQGDLNDKVVTDIVAAHVTERKAQADQLGKIAETHQPIADYRASAESFWTTDGPTFGDRLLQPGDLLFDGLTPDSIQIVDYGRARRDPVWNGLKISAGVDRDQGKLAAIERSGKTGRTGTITLAQPKVYALVRGVGRILAVVDSHRLVQGPLHGAVINDFDTGGKWRWVQMNLDAYVGHGVHLEFTPKAESEIGVMMAVAGTASPPLPLHMAFGSAGDQPGEVAGAKNLADHFRSHFEMAQRSLARDDFDSPATAGLANWMVGQRSLFKNNPAATDSSAIDKKRNELISGYQEKEAALTKQIRTTSRTALAMWEGDSVNEHLLIRGNTATPGDLTPRRLLTGIAGEEQEPIAVGSGRMQLVDRLVAPSNPFFSRVMTNRVWHHLIGRGIAPSVDNFGVLGAEPSHPELLDHLAVRFRQDGFSVKQLIRTIMLSSTYQMSSEIDAKAEEADPTNRWLHRAHVRRLQGEAIRDNILAVSGRLDRKMFGKSTPVFLTQFMQGRGRPGQGPLDGAGRRSIYISVRRNFLSPMMLAFDVPQPFSTVGKRSVSNVPAQALILMNDPFVVAEAKRWSEKLAKEANEPEERIKLMYLQAFARPANNDELVAAKQFLVLQGKERGVAEDAALTDAKAWSDLCHVMFNVKEFIFLR